MNQKAIKLIESFEINNLKNKTIKTWEEFNENLASKDKWNIIDGDNEPTDDEILKKEFDDIEKTEILDNKFSENEEKLDDYTPPFQYDDSNADHQIENAGIIKATVFITYSGVNNTKQLNYEQLEEDFLTKTDFDEVDVSINDDFVVYSINIYDYDNNR